MKARISDIVELSTTDLIKTAYMQFKTNSEIEASSFEDFLEFVSGIEVQLVSDKEKQLIKEINLRSMGLK